MSQLPIEDQEQQALVAWLRGRGYKCHHSPNATGHTPEARRRAIRMKRLGTSAGFPDLLIFAEGHRIAIEMKRSKGGTTTPLQRAWLELLSLYGFQSAVCHGAEEAREFIEQVIKEKI